LPETRNDPVDVRYLFAAKAEYIGRTGHLLFHRSLVLLRKSRILNGDVAADRYRKAQDNSAGSHLPILLLEIHFPVNVPRGRGKHLASSLKINEAWEGSRRTTKCESGAFRKERCGNVGSLSLLHLELGDFF
jgi:hypothetical protein